MRWPLALGPYARELFLMKYRKGLYIPNGGFFGLWPQEMQRYSVPLCPSYTVGSRWRDCLGNEVGNDEDLYEVGFGGYGQSIYLSPGSNPWLKVGRVRQPSMVMINNDNAFDQSGATRPAFRTPERTTICWWTAMPPRPPTRRIPIGEMRTNWRRSSGIRMRPAPTATNTTTNRSSP